ncbi:glycosyltransferase family 1 protein [Pseudothermotoga sp.]|uniref:glycosyltransferase family 4 protein n=1 Tax=Pseudothermotoga sp. TaxID=2033661 RepID=UPI0031F6014D
MFIDGTFYRASGIGRYYSNLVKLMLEETDWKLITTVPESKKKDWLEEFNSHENITPIFVKHRKFSVEGFWKLGKIIKELEKECQVFWFPQINLPSYVPENTIVTIHDLCPLTHWWDRGTVRKILFAQLAKRAIKKARIVVVPSNFTKEELLKNFPEVEGKVKVVYNFVDEKFLTKQASDEPPLVKEDYILYVGNRKKHKNLKNLVLAYLKVKDQVHCKLVIAGTRDKNKTKDEIDELIQKLKIEKFIIQFDSPTDSVIMNLYRHAKLFVFPSFYEGFGFPPLEALACGCPVITSNIPVLIETLGEEIACFDPNSVNDMAEKITEIIKNSSKRKKILNLGEEKLSKFSKSALIESYMNLLSQLEVQ